MRRWLPAALALAAFAAFLLATPSGLLAKTRMVGYAVCHQIASHSFAVGGYQLPLCARCTGTFIGALVGLVGQYTVLGRRRPGAFPPTRVLGVLALFFVALGIDGINSYLTFFPALPHLYEPANWLRLTTGTLYGLAMSAVIYPVVGYSLLRNPSPIPSIGRFRDLAVLLVMGAAFILLVLSQWPALLYPLALLSALGVLVLLTSVNTVVVVILAKRENSSAGWREAIPDLLLGFCCSAVEAGLISLARYWLTGTLDGIPLLN